MPAAPISSHLAVAFASGATLAAFIAYRILRVRVQPATPAQPATPEQPTAAHSLRVSRVVHLTTKTGPKAS